MSNYKNSICEIIKATVSNWQAERVCELLEWDIPVIPYYTIRNNEKVKIIPALSKYQQWLRKPPDELTEDFWKWLYEEWKRSKEKNRVRGWGIFLGPPSGYLVMFDFDSEDIGKLFDSNRKMWMEEAKTIAKLIGDEFHVVVERKAGINYVMNKSIMVATRRGAHIIVKLAKEDWEKLYGTIGVNRELGDVCIPPVEGREKACGKLELRTLGVTPLVSFKHRITGFIKPYPFSLKKINSTLKWLKLEEIKVASKLYNTSISQSQTNIQYNRKVSIKRDNAINGRKESYHKYKDKQKTFSEGREMSDSDIGKLAEIISPYWVHGHRNNVELGLLGWLIKSGIKLESAKEVIRRICERAGDEELEQRLYEVDRQYTLVRTGEKTVEELVGKTGLISELETIIKQQNPSLADEEARDRALTIISELEKLIGPTETILVRTPYKTNTWFVNDPHRGIVLLKEKPNENGEIKRSREYISDWYIRQALVVKEDRRYLYKILFTNARTNEKIVLSGQLDEVTKELKRMHGVKRSQVVTDAVGAIISELIRRKVVKLKRTASVVGILPTKTGLKLVRVGALSRLLIPKHINMETARKALETLVKLREHFDHKKFDVVINWAAYAPLGYALKVLFSVKQVHLLLHGEKQTGKTTLGRIVRSLYPTRTSDEEDVPEEGQSEYRLAWKLNIATTPILEDEVQGISRKPALLGLLKRASTGDLVRWRGDTNRRYHARAALILTSNYTEVLEDPALVERVIPLFFTYTDYVYSKPQEQREEFKRLYNQYQALAPHLGAVILETIIENWEEIVNYWPHRLQEKSDYLEFGQWIWQKVSGKLGVNQPDWATTEVKIEEEPPVIDEEEVFWTVIQEAVRDAINRNQKLFSEIPTDLWGRIKILAEHGLLPGWIHVRRDGIILTSPILQELKKYGLQPIGGLQGLSNRLGFEYNVWNVRKRSVRGIMVPKKTLIYEIATPEELADEIKADVRFMLNMRKLKPLLRDIADYIVKRWGIDKVTAGDIAEMILDEYAEENMYTENAGKETVTV